MIKFPNIYIEKNALDHSNTKKILDYLRTNKYTLIDHYKDVFCRPRQNPELQKQNPNLILAIKHKDYLYPGASICQDFGYDSFYYSSCVANCICNCDYCYLKGMYPSGHILVFVNLEDYFTHIGNKKYYICVSYDTDLFPLEPMLGYVDRWCAFAKKNPNILLEIRTKFKSNDIWKIDPPNNVIFAFSLSPQEIIAKHEKGTSNLQSRLSNICSAQNAGFKNRLCFDPIIYTSNWASNYSSLINQCFNTINVDKVEDISVGSFRISQTYLKNIRKYNQTSEIVNFPFSNINGYYQYHPQLQKQMEDFVYNNICKYFDKEKVYLWN